MTIIKFILLFLIFNSCPFINSCSKIRTTKLEINKISQNVLNFIFREKGINRFEMPKKDPFPFHPPHNSTYDNDSSTDYTYEALSDPFSFTVKREASNETIFSTKGMNIIFLENYAEVTTMLPSKFIFGLGERTTSFRLQPGVYTMYNRDAVGEIDDGMGGNNRYGSHPMYLMREKSGLYHVVYLRNTFPMDVIITNIGSHYLLTYRILGGILDFSIFLGDKNPETSIKLYHEFLGKHSLPPFWAMGFHQSRWGYQNLETLHDVLQKYSDYKLPLDTLWMDIDYMKDYIPFTVDESRYNITLFKEYLQTYKKKFIMIAEPAIATVLPDNKYLVKGKELDLFIKNKQGKFLINRVWPGDCHFIDYFHVNTKHYWSEALNKLHEKLDFSGIWLDMNELATFESGQVNENDERISCDDETVYPYLPANLPLERNTICPNAVHYNGYKHVEVHNYNPVAQQMLTHQFLEKKFPDQFPFILSRANSAGTNKWSFHWTGDNLSTFEFYKGSVSEILNNNIFGIPMVGADICGFMGNPNQTETQCAKFYQMGSLYPFSRSHSDLNSVRKEPWQMGDILLKTTQKSLSFRYAILKFYYSLFISNAGTGTVFRPLFFNFLFDEEVISDYVIDSQFMIGEDLLAVPNFNEDDTTTNVKAYFPNGSWYDLRYNTKVGNTNGSYIKIEAVMNEMPAVFLRGGKTIFTNNIENVENTYDLDSNFNFLISFDTTQDDMYVSNGKIPAVMNYQSKIRINQCMEFNCWVNINSSFTIKDISLNIKFSKAEFYDEDFKFINALSFKIYGIDISGLTVDQTNLNNLIEGEVKVEDDLIENMIFGNSKTIDSEVDKKFKEFKHKTEFLKQIDNMFEIEYVNESYFIIHINGLLKISKEDVDITIEFI